MTTEHNAKCFYCLHESRTRTQPQNIWRAAVLMKLRKTRSGSHQDFRQPWFGGSNVAERSAVGSMRSDRGAFGHNKSTSRQDFRFYASLPKVSTTSATFFQASYLLAWTAATTSLVSGHRLRKSMASKPPFRETTVLPSTTTSNWPRLPVSILTSIPIASSMAVA